jgi:hypothetical protein
MQTNGRPCDRAFQGDSADVVIKSQGKHLKEMVANGDIVHQEAAKAMQGRWTNPIKGMGWYLKTNKDFGALPES